MYILIAGGITEILVMSLYALFPPMPELTGILVDIALSILVVFPVIFLGLMRPLRRLWEERQQVQDELELAQQRLEQRVQERTQELAQANESLLLEITERKKAEAALLEKRSRLQFFLHQVPAILWSTDNQLNITYTDGAGLTILGLEPDKLVGMTLNEFARVNNDHLIYAAHQKALGGESLAYEIEAEGHWYKVSLEPFLDSMGNITGSIGLAMDITDQKEAANRLRLQSIALDAAANGIMITDCQGTIQWANQALSEMTGYPLEEIIGNNPRILNSGLQDRAFYADLWGTILEGKVWRGELTNRRQDGSLYIEEQTITPFRDEAGEILRFIAIKQDITKRVHAQREVQRRNQELARLNEIAAIASSSLDEQVILENIQRFFSEEMQISCGRIYRVHTQDKLLYLEARWGVPEVEAQSFTPLPLEAFPNQRVVQKQEVVIEQQLACDLAPWFTVQGEAQQTWMRHIWTPLVASGQILGVLELFESASTNDFPEDCRFFHVLGRQIGMALQNAGLFNQVSAGHDRLQHLSRQLVNLQENERAYVARELHDVTSQALAAMLVDLDLLSRSTHDCQAVAVEVAELEDLVGQVMDNLHEIAVKLRPASLDHLGLVGSLRQYVEEFGQKHKISAHFATFGHPVYLSAEVEMALYRINQETLTNVARHAKASHVDVVLEFRPEEIALLIEDDGVGFKPHVQADQDHLGLLGIRERVEMFGGSLLIDSAPGEGTVLKVTIPWASNGLQTSVGKDRTVLV